MGFRLWREEEGSAVVLVALAMTVVMGFAALVIDIGIVAVEKWKLQNALDATSLAAAMDLPDTAAAAATADQYIQLNGYDPTDISVSFKDANKTITISGTKQVKYTFAKVLGFDSTDLHVSASATGDTIGGAFNYVLFSGSDSFTLTLNGSHQYIQGSSHTNEDFLANGSHLTITGACEAVGNVTTNGSNIDIAHRVPGANYVEMPDFADTIRLQAEQIGTVYNGDKTFNGSYLDVDEPIYVDGDLTVNGSHFRGAGCVLVTGNIIFNGSNLNESTGDAVCFYSQNGDITINGSHAVFDGILYAPNGNITMNGSHQTVNGRVIGDEVRFNGSSLNIIGGTGELRSLPSKGVRLVK